LRNGNSEFPIGGTLPDVGASEKPGDISHEFNLEFFIESEFEGSFDVVGFGEICKVINIYADIDRRVAVDKDASEDKRIVGAQF
jgi:hypothetical protein